MKDVQMPGQAASELSVTPMEGWKGNMSIMAMTASIMAMSTRCPTPVARAPLRAARIPMAAKSPLPMSPNAPATPMIGLRPGSGRKALRPPMASATAA
jgi:hypothetical protein